MSSLGGICLTACCQGVCKLGMEKSPGCTTLALGILFLALGIFLATSSVSSEMAGGYALITFGSLFIIASFVLGCIACTRK